jgi:hypothetical protein
MKNISLCFGCQRNTPVKNNISFFFFMLWLWIVTGIQGCNSSVPAAWDYRIDLQKRLNDYKSVIAPDGTSYLTFLTDETHSIDELKLIKLDPTGKEVWKHLFSLQGEFFFQFQTCFIGPLLDLNGDVIIGYRKYCSTIVSTDDVCGEVIEKIGADGTKIWTKTFATDPANEILERSKGPVLDAAGNVYIAYEIANVNGQYETWVVQYLADGSVGWRNQYTRLDSQNTHLDDLAISNDGLAYIYIVTHDSEMINVTAYTTGGVQQWVHSYPHPGNQRTNEGAPLSGINGASIKVSPRGILTISASMFDYRIAEKNDYVQIRAISNAGNFLFNTVQFPVYNAPSIEIDLSGNLYLRYFSGIIQRMGEDGNTLWEYSMGVSNPMKPQVRFDQEDAVYFLVPTSKDGYSIVKLDATGTPVWRKERQYPSYRLPLYYTTSSPPFMEISESQQLYLSTTQEHGIFIPAPDCPVPPVDCVDLFLPTGVSTVTHVYDTNGVQLRKIRAQNRDAKHISVDEQGAFYQGTRSVTLRSMYNFVNSYPEIFHFTKYNINR